MRLKDRVAQLEKRLDALDFLSGALAYQPEEIIINGVRYRAIEDIPEDVREVMDPIKVGKILRNGSEIGEVFV